MKEPKWINEKTVLAIHHEQIAIHGRLSGIRDEGLMLSALERPKNLFFYENADILRCAAAYTFGLVRNHAFQDGNKRTGFIVGVAFLLLNGYKFSAAEPDVVLKISSLAAGELTEAELLDWISAHSTLHTKPS
ncbi:type II toxin-antitoxin system death-on-curing family toxin [Marinoscillum furvescens]|uniref:Death-on-curing protein n=1 Tax=Marinoscillum furvescens DSM 4134 TaxID=1122208 RepID=A0A3D9L7G7_MARFU|nr:type II toxin-antitoxin system death-on-curing family toxin [Marinoscillum furvescens]REE01599.1 death-on-curing protein [Marinoscillum furvescens DSM 4134]